MELLPQQKQIQIIDEHRMIGIAAIGFAIDENSGDVLLMFDQVFSDVAAKRLTIPFGRLAFADFVRRCQQAIPSNSNGEGPELLQ